MAGSIMEFIKYQATGNDFVLIEVDRSESLDWPSLARKVCDRHFGVGADGILLVLPSSRASYKMRMFNPDGSEAETCGNGLRCFARYVVEKNGAARAGKITIETLAGIKEAIPYFEKDQVKSVSLFMGKPSFKLKDLPVLLPEFEGKIPVIDYPLKIDRTNLNLTFISMGNPHVVHFLGKGEDIDQYPLGDVGPRVEHHAIFPRRTNFEVVQIVDRSNLKARVWERGAGETLSCGSGACAIAVAARLRGMIDDEVDIKLPGGILSLFWDGKGEIKMTGPVEEVFRGIWRID